MSPLNAPARMHIAPVMTGRERLSAAPAQRTMTTTTTTITTGSGWVSVRE